MKANGTAGRRNEARVVDPAIESSDPARRDFMSTMVKCGVALPAVYGLLDGANASAASAANPSTPQSGPRVMRLFSDPRVELIRLLREAAEVEHSLMLQYLYCAFSVRPQYSALIGSGAPTSDNLVGVAVQEMQHLGAVNRLLMTIGAAPNLLAMEFPHEPEIYPFEFKLEPMSLKSLAKYIYAEAPIGFFEGKRSAEDEAFASAVIAVIGPKRRPNYVGSLYATVIDLVKEYARQPGVPKMDSWVTKLEQIKEEGEVDHFKFFKSIFLATHPAFGGNQNVWERPVSHPAYPSFGIPENPTAYVGHENQIVHPVALGVAWISDLHYWLALMLTDHYYRYNDATARGMALGHMMGPVFSLGRHLPSLGYGVPFDPVNFGSAPSINEADSRRMIAAIAKEIVIAAKRVGRGMPADYSLALTEATIGMFDGPARG
jgi:Ferritin-like